MCLGPHGAQSAWYTQVLLLFSCLNVKNAPIASCRTEQREQFIPFDYFKMKSKNKPLDYKGFTAYKNKETDAHIHTQMQTKSSLIGLGQLFGLIH